MMNESRLVLKGVFQKARDQRVFNYTVLYRIFSGLNLKKTL